MCIFRNIEVYISTNKVDHFWVAIGAAKMGKLIKATIISRTRNQMLGEGGRGHIVLPLSSPFIL